MSGTLEETDPIPVGTRREFDEVDESVDGMLREIAAAPPVHPSAAPEPGELIGGAFRIERLLGEGGMGVVYLAHDEKLDRKVALKLQRADRSERLVQRLAREARAMARVSHPNVVPVHEVGEHRGRVFIAMEYVDGGTARDWVLALRSWEQIVDLYAAAGRGLAAAHAIGLVHRDFKPDNVLVGRDGRPRVADFGLARAATVAGGSRVHESWEAPSSSEVSRSEDLLRDRITKTGAAVGTAQYMAPEQHGSGEVDARADQFSFCVALYEALAQRRPFSGRTPAKLLHNIHLGRLRPPRDDRRLPPHVLAVLRRGLSADPKDRFPTMDALLARLVRKPRSRWRIAAVVGGLALAGGVGAFVAADEAPDPCEVGSRRLEAVWSDATRAEVEDAVDAHGKAYAREGWDRAIEPMTAYAGAWSDAYRDACEATHVRREQPIELLHKRVACLDRRRLAFVHLVESLRVLDDSTASGIHDLVQGLPRLDPCADLEALGRTEDLPADEETRRTIERLEEEHARVRAMDSAVDRDEMIREFEGLLEEAEAVGYGPLIGHLRVNLAETLHGVGNFDDDAMPRQAFHDALAAGDDRLALQAVTLLVRFHAGRRSPEAHTWAETGRALMKKVRDPIAGVPLMRAEAIAYAIEGRHPEAIELFQANVSLLREHAPHHRLLRVAYDDLGNAYGRQGDVPESARWVQQALDQALADLGPHHPDVAEASAHLGRLRAVMGDLEGALPLVENAVAVLTAAQGPTSVRVAHMAFNLADIHAQLGNRSRALEVLGPAIETLRGAVGEERWVRMDAEVTYAGILADEGRLAEARTIIDRLLVEQRGDDVHPSSRVYTALILARFQAEEGDCETAIDTARQAIALIEKAGLVEYLASLHEVVASCSIELGRRDEAIAAYERAIEAHQRSGRVPVELARTRLGLAKLLRADPAQSERVETLRRLALDYVESRSDPESVRLAELARDLSGR